MCDSVAWLLALHLLTISRFFLSTDVSTVQWSDILWRTTATSVVCVLFGAGVGWLTGLYRSRYVAGSLEELRTLTYTALIVWFLAAVTILVTESVPRSVVVALFPTALVLMAGVRIVARLAAENHVAPGGSATPVLLYGAGDLGHSVVKQMKVDPLSRFRPIGFIDDDTQKRRRVIGGISVLGTGNELKTLVGETGAEGVVICVNGVDSKFLSRVHSLTEELGIRMLVFPSINDALTPRKAPSSLRDVSVDDLVGRHPSKIDLTAVAEYISGKRVLVTGAGGSIGSELCRQIHKFGPSQLIMLDHDESGLHTTQMSIYGHGLLDTSDAVLTSIRDGEKLSDLFQSARPDVVFHAAALKHLPLLEQYPEEAWKTNVLGTLNVLKASLSCNVDRFVNISTDKAANPTSSLGHSKRVAERLTAWASEVGEGKYVSVRFGNVLGSRGSMLPTFQAQIESGGPLTVTHPNVTRYFMTIPEACELVVQAGAIGDDGQVMVLEMGEPVRILDVATRMIEMSGKDVDIVFTGLRPGEKLHEDLFGLNEATASPVHPRIAHSLVKAIDPADLDLELWLRRASDKSLLVRSDAAAGVSRRDASKLNTTSQSLDQ